jgi:hypothetical protein
MIAYPQNTEFIERFQNIVKVPFVGSYHYQIHNHGYALHDKKLYLVYWSECKVECCHPKDESSDDKKEAE